MVYDIIDCLDGTFTYGEAMDLTLEEALYIRFKALLSAKLEASIMVFNKRNMLEAIADLTNDYKLAIQELHPLPDNGTIKIGYDICPLVYNRLIAHLPIFEREFPTLDSYTKAVKELIGDKSLSEYRLCSVVDTVLTSRGLSQKDIYLYIERNNWEDFIIDFYNTLKSYYKLPNQNIMTRLETVFTNKFMGLKPVIEDYIDWIEKDLGIHLYNDLIRETTKGNYGLTLIDPLFRFKRLNLKEHESTQI